MHNLLFITPERFQVNNSLISSQIPHFPIPTEYCLLQQRDEYPTITNCSINPYILVYLVVKSYSYMSRVFIGDAGCDDKLVTSCWGEAEHPLQMLLLVLQISFWLMKIVFILWFDKLIYLAKMTLSIALHLIKPEIVVLCGSLSDVVLFFLTTLCSPAL